jgi:hypothetical protein
MTTNPHIGSSFDDFWREEGFSLDPDVAAVIKAASDRARKAWLEEHAATYAACRLAGFGSQDADRLACAAADGLACPGAIGDSEDE